MRNISMSQEFYNKRKQKEVSELLGTEVRMDELEKRFETGFGLACKMLDTITTGNYANKNVFYLAQKREEFILQNNEIVDLVTEYQALTGEIPISFKKYSALQNIILNEIENAMDRQIAGEIK